MALVSTVDATHSPRDSRWLACLSCALVEWKLRLLSDSSLVHLSCAPWVPDTCRSLLKKRHTISEVGERVLVAVSAGWTELAGLFPAQSKHCSSKMSLQGKLCPSVPRVWQRTGCQHPKYCIRFCCEVLLCMFLYVEFFKSHFGHNPLFLNSFAFNSSEFLLSLRSWASIRWAGGSDRNLNQLCEGTRREGKNPNLKQCSNSVIEVVASRTVC